MKSKLNFDDVLNVIKEFQTKYPTAHVGGSIGLYLHGIKLSRGILQSDIDMTVGEELPQKVDLENIFDSSDTSDFERCFRKDLSADGGLYVKIDVRFSPEPTFEIINLNGIDYNVSHVKNILFWKRRYARNGIAKHCEDLKEITGEIIPYTVYTATVNSDDDLPF